MKTYKTGRPAWLALCLVLFLLAALLAAGALRARFLLRTVLDGRRERIQEEQPVSSFSLYAEMGRQQMQPRISGWLSVAPGEPVTVKTARGELSATAYPAVYGGEDAPWVLVLHGGLGTTRAQVEDVACMLSLNGYRVLAPDLYAHGESDGEIASMGAGDAQDVQAWVQWIRMEDADARIALFGQDEGAVAALLAAGEGLPVFAVVADSAFSDSQKQVEQLLEEAGYGALDAWLFGLAYRLTYGENTLLSQVGAIEVPVLLIHGTGDQEAAAWSSEDIAQAVGEGAQMLFIEGAGHGMARYLEPDTYYETLMRFLETALDEAK